MVILWKKYQIDFRAWILSSKHSGCCSPFEKLKTLSQWLVFFSRFSQVSQHPACLDHSIPTRESIWYFLHLSWLHCTTLFRVASSIPVYFLSSFPWCTHSKLCIYRIMWLTNSFVIWWWFDKQQTVCQIILFPCIFFCFSFLSLLYFLLTETLPKLMRNHLEATEPVE